MSYHDEIEEIMSEFNEYNKHDPVLCGRLHSTKLINASDYSIPDGTLINGKVFSELTTYAHQKHHNAYGKSKDKPKSKPNANIKSVPKPKSKPKSKDKRR